MLQTVFSLLVRYGGGVYLTPLEKLSLCMAAVCHDIRHPGLSNAFHINARTPLALLYNDQSVLEHHHAASAFRILERPDLNILGSLSTGEYRAVRQRLTLGILATDMTGHFGLIEKFNSFLDEQAKLPANLAAAAAASAAAPSSSSAGSSPSLGPSTPSFPPLSLPVFQIAHELGENSRAVIFNALLHASDISNPAKPWRAQKIWSDAVLQEFLNQGDVEAAKGLQVSPNCDRNNTDQALLSLNFIESVTTTTAK